MTDNLDEIIAGCINEDSKSQEELYRLLSPVMYNVCLQYASDHDEAKDFLQEGFINVFTKIKSFRHEGSFEGWVRKIIVNTALQFLRKKKQIYVIREELTEDKDHDITEIDFELNEEDLLGMIQGLTVNQRIVFNLYAIEGYNHAEITKLTGIPENTSKSHLHRARVSLKEMIKKRNTSEPRKKRNA